MVTWSSCPAGRSDQQAERVGSPRIPQRLTKGGDLAGEGLVAWQAATFLLLAVTAGRELGSLPRFRGLADSGGITVAVSRRTRGPLLPVAGW
jgi:hypothetical protein